MTHPLIDEVMRKTSLAWLTVGDGPAYAVWCLGAEDALYVVSGPGEQPAPGLVGASDVLVTARGDHGGRVVTWRAGVVRIWPGTSDWDAIAPLLAAKRLNATGPLDGVVARWAADCAISRLVPTGQPVEIGETLPDDSGAAPPRPTPATRRPRNPFRLHRVRKRR